MTLKDLTPEEREKLEHMVGRRTLELYPGPEAVYTVLETKDINDCIETIISQRPKPEPRVWVPVKPGPYWTVLHDGSVDWDEYDGRAAGGVTDKAITFGNYHRTRAEAEHAAKLARARNWADKLYRGIVGDWTPKCGGDRTWFYQVFSTMIHGWQTGCLNNFGGDSYRFPTEPAAQEWRNGLDALDPEYLWLVLTGREKPEVTP